MFLFFSRMNTNEEGGSLSYWGLVEIYGFLTWGLTACIPHAAWVTGSY